MPRRRTRARARARRVSVRTVSSGGEQRIDAAREAQERAKADAVARHAEERREQRRRARPARRTATSCCTEPVVVSTYQPRISASISKPIDVARSAGHWKRKLRTAKGDAICENHCLMNGSKSICGARSSSPPRAGGRRGADRRARRPAGKIIGEGWNRPIAGARSDRARRDPGDARRCREGRQLPADRRDAVCHARALRDVRRRHVPCAHRATWSTARPIPRSWCSKSTMTMDGRRARRGVRRDPDAVLRRANDDPHRPQEAGADVRRARPMSVSTAKKARARRTAASARRAAGTSCAPRSAPASRWARCSCAAGRPAKSGRPQLHAQYPGRDWILTRILWLSGCEAGQEPAGRRRHHAPLHLHPRLARHAPRWASPARSAACACATATSSSCSTACRPTRRWRSASSVWSSWASRCAARFGFFTTPRSVMMPVISSAGVTSKAGLRTATPSGAQRLPR